MLSWGGFGDHWDRCRPNEAVYPLNLLTFQDVCMSSAFSEFFSDERSAGFRAYSRYAWGVNISSHIAKGSVWTPQSRKLFIGQLNRDAYPRDIVITQFLRMLFELARMRERKCLKAFLNLERERLL
jgi:hypothetical protein